MTDRRRSRPTNRSKTVTAVRPAISAGRVRVLGLVFALVFGAFAYRLVDLQVTPDPTLADSAGGRIERVDLPATRGSFLDRYGRPLAITRPSATVVVNPRLVADADIPAMVNQLAPHAALLPLFIARMQCRQFDGDTGVLADILGPRPCRKRRDRMCISTVIALRVALGLRALAEHIVGIGVPPALLPLGPL